MHIYSGIEAPIEAPIEGPIEGPNKIGRHKYTEAQQMIRFLLEKVLTKIWLFYMSSKERTLQSCPH